MGEEAEGGRGIWAGAFSVVSGAGKSGISSSRIGYLERFLWVEGPVV